MQIHYNHNLTWTVLLYEDHMSTPGTNKDNMFM